jgi:glycerol kinase
MSADSGVPLKQMRVDGGITANSLCMQMQADIMGVEIIRPLITETTALGAAYAAGLAIGFWKNTDELAEQWKESRRWKPVSNEKQRRDGYAGWKRAIECT